MTKWGKAVTTVKKAIAKKKYPYSQLAYTHILVGLKKLNVRHDCSGYVSAALQYIGAKGFITSSAGFSSNEDVAKKLRSLGFTKLKFTSWKDCKQFDIVSQSGAHVEIFDHYEGGIAYVYSNGSTNGLANQSYGKDGGKHHYDTVWRYLEK